MIGICYEVWLVEDWPDLLVQVLLAAVFCAGEEGRGTGGRGGFDTVKVDNGWVSPGKSTLVSEAEWGRDARLDWDLGTASHPHCQLGRLLAPAAAATSDWMGWLAPPLPTHSTLHTDSLSLLSGCCTVFYWSSTYKIWSAIYTYFS